MREEKKERAIGFRRRHHHSPIETKIPSSGFFFSFPRATIGVLFCLSLFLSLSFCFETTLNALTNVFS